MTNSAPFLASVRDSLAAITAPRFFETERGFQGELLVQLGQRLRLPDQAILEQEYQKRQQEHGLSIRPDIIVHEPFDPARHTARADGNFAVIELKLNATTVEAAKDFQSLVAMIQTLHYPLGIFVNIAATTTYANLIPAHLRGQIVSFAVSLQEGKTRVVQEEG